MSTTELGDHPTMNRGAERTGYTSAEPDEAREFWESLLRVELDERRLARGRIVTASRKDQSSMLFDVLRTRILRALRERGWTRVAITSPGTNCGKTFVAANLALAFGKLPACPTVLLDIDLRIPSLSKLLGVPAPAAMSQFLLGEVEAVRFLRRVRPNLAVGFSTVSELEASEILQHPSTTATLRGLHARSQPQVMLYDLPPLLECDDVLAFVPHVDAALLVVRGGRTKPDDIRACERLLSGQMPLLGIVLNCAEDKLPKPYGYYRPR